MGNCLNCGRYIDNVKTFNRRMFCDDGKTCAKEFRIKNKINPILGKIARFPEKYLAMLPDMQQPKPNYSSRESIEVIVPKNIGIRIDIKHSNIKHLNIKINDIVEISVSLIKRNNRKYSKSKTSKCFKKIPKSGYITITKPLNTGNELKLKVNDKVKVDICVYARYKESPQETFIKDTLQKVYENQKVKG